MNSAPRPASVLAFLALSWTGLSLGCGGGAGPGTFCQIIERCGELAEGLTAETCLDTLLAGRQAAFWDEDECERRLSVWSANAPYPCDNVAEEDLCGLCGDRSLDAVLARSCGPE